MADTAVHAANAGNYIAIAVELRPRNAAIAGETCWGTAVQAAQALLTPEVATPPTRKATAASSTP